MKKLLTILFFFASTLRAADPAPVTYTGHVAGIFCEVCSAKIKHHLEKMPGVKAVTLTPSRTAGVANLEIKSTKEINQASAAKALGEDGKLYQIQDIKPAKQP